MTPPDPASPAVRPPGPARANTWLYVTFLVLVGGYVGWCGKGFWSWGHAAAVVAATALLCWADSFRLWIREARHPGAARFREFLLFSVPSAVVFGLLLGLLLLGVVCGLVKGLESAALRSAAGGAAGGLLGAVAARRLHRQAPPQSAPADEGNGLQGPA